MTQVIDIAPTGSYAALDIHGADAETRAILGFLSRYPNPRTQANYELDLKQFRGFITGPPSNRLSLLHVDRTDVNMYLLGMTGRLAQATVARRVGTLRMFYKFAVLDDLIVKDPTLHVETPKVDHDAQRRTWLTTLQFAKLLHHVRPYPRSHAMVVSLGMLGLRVAEMCSLDVGDVRRLVGAAEVTFIGKGGRTFSLDLPLEVLTAYDTYTAGRADGPLFLTADGNRRWTTNDARRHLQTLKRHADLADVDITPHGLRRTAARTLAERGVELGAIQEFLRHRDPRVTKLCYIGSDSGAGSLARQLLAGVYGNTAR